MCTMKTHCRSTQNDEGKMAEEGHSVSNADLIVSRGLLLALIIQADHLPVERATKFCPLRKTETETGVGGGVGGP